MLSSTEAEYVPFLEYAKKVIWLSWLWHELGIAQERTTVGDDNEGNKIGHKRL